MKHCFVLMPFGEKNNGTVSINFNKVYGSIIKPAIEESGLKPIRADEEQVGGIIHKPMFERLLLCEFAIADLTFANANVFYELGVRHTHKRHTTILMFAKSTTSLPFDVSLLRGLPYSVDSKGNLTDIEGDKKNLLSIINKARQNQTTDSPLFQLLQDYPDIGHMKADVFRDQVEYSDNLKNKLLKIRTENKKDKEQLLEKLLAFEKHLGDLDQIEIGVLIDLMLSYRGCGTDGAYNAMINLIDNMPGPVRQTVMVIEQKALALNRVKKDVEAEKLLKDLIEEKGPSSETYGILGRVYKDRWTAAKEVGDPFKEEGALADAIAAYEKGFRADIRDAYPGINAVTLMFIHNAKSKELKELLPVVKYAVKRKLEFKDEDYWDYATLFELAIVEQDLKEAKTYLSKMMSFEETNEAFMYKTTLNNLKILAESGAYDGEDLNELQGFMSYLKDKFDKKSKPN